MPSAICLRQARWTYFPCLDDSTFKFETAIPVNRRRAAERHRAFWRVQAFLSEAKTLLPGELISPGSFEIPGSPQSGALWGDLPETSQMDLFSMFG